MASEAIICFVTINMYFHVALKVKINNEPGKVLHNENQGRCLPVARGLVQGQIVTVPCAETCSREHHFAQSYDVG